MITEWMNGLWYAKFKLGNWVCVGYSPIRREATEFCEELIRARMEKLEHRG